MIFSSRFWIWM